MPSEASNPDDPTSGPKSSTSLSLEEILDHYLEELAEDKHPDQESYLKKYPDKADALRGVFRTLDFVEATSKSLNASQLERGDQLGDYRIVRVAGRGGMGVVYEAVQTSLNRRVALKVLPPSAILTDNAQERFEREAATAGRLHHTNIVPVYAVGEEQGIHFYVMQYIEGRSLSEYLTRLREARTPLDADYFRRVVRWGQQVAAALAYAHSSGTIHRDIKPSNLLLDARDNVWVTDFGLARMDSHATITVTGDVIGTARYMSPEQACGGRSQLDERTDIYSLGATIYELLTLAPAYDGESRESVLNRITFASAKPLRQVNRAIPKDIETIISKCMEKPRERRYLSAEDVSEDFRRFLAGEPIRARRTSIITKAYRHARRHPVRTIGSLVLVLLVSVTVFLAGTIKEMRGQGLVDEAFQAIVSEGDNDRAQKLLKEAADMGVDSAKLHLHLGLLRLGKTEPHRAIEHLNRALERDKNDVEVLYALAYAYTSTSDAVNGERYFSRACEHEITTPLAWLYRGHTLSMRQDPSAIEAYNEAIKLRRDFTLALEARAGYHGQQLLVEGDRSHLEPMLNDYEAWVVLWPRSGSYSSRGIGWLFAAAFASTQADLKDNVPLWLDRCRSDIDQSLDLRRPDQKGALLQRGVYCRYIKDYQGSADAFYQAMNIDRLTEAEVHPGYVHHYVLALHSMGAVDKALEALAPACQVKPVFFPLLLHQSAIMAEMGDLEGAISSVESVKADVRGNATGVFLTAAFFELLGEQESAIALVNQFVDMTRDSGNADEINALATHPVMRFFSREIDEEELIASADGHPGKLCESWFFAALRRFGDGQQEQGIAALRSCIDSGVIIYLEYRLAQVFLARIEADPSWPAWITPVDAHAPELGAAAVPRADLP